MSEFHKADVDLSGLMKVLGDHLYSTPFVAIRELIQNSHDAIVRRRSEDSSEFSPWIRVVADPTHNTLSISDNGAGLTHDEIQKYLATVGTGYTRQLRETLGDGSTDLIGMFGLGFLSAFVIAEKTAVTTVSYQTPDRAWVYQSRTGETYTLAGGNAGRDGFEVGTTVTLTLKEKFHTLLDPQALHIILQKYCALLRVPVLLGEGEHAVNATPPPWRRDDLQGIGLTKARLAFVAPFENTFEPIAVLPIPVNKAGVEGVLWIQDGSSYGNSDNRNLHVFVRGMMLDDDARDLLPRWAGFMGGVIESPHLTPTASREDLQRDEMWEQTLGVIKQACIDGIRALPATDPEAWRRVCSHHNEALLGAALADDDLFDLLRDLLTIPTSEGDLHVKSVFARGAGKAYVSLAVRGGFEETLFRAQKVPVVSGRRYGASSFCERYAASQGGQVIKLGTKEGNAAVFRKAELSKEDLAHLQEVLGSDEVAVVAARFEPAVIPLVMVPDRDAELKAALESDEADKRISAGVLALARKFTAGITQQARTNLYVNVVSPPITAILEARHRDVATAQLKMSSGVALLKAAATLTSGSGEQGANDFIGAYQAIGEAAMRALRDSIGEQLGN